jgi:hypothetical protein
MAFSSLFLKKVDAHQFYSFDHQIDLSKCPPHHKLIGKKIVNDPLYPIPMVPIWKLEPQSLEHPLPFCSMDY